jgi:hypothetical protein
MVPVRAAPVFCATLKLTKPLPVPPVDAPNNSHAAFDVVVQAHAGADAVTANEPLPPVSANVCADGEIENVQGGGGGAACVTVNVCPAIATVPVRAAPVFAATVTATLALPVPLVRSTVIHAAPGVAVQAHVGADAVTATGPDPPVSGTFWLAGAIENVHGGGVAAACVMVMSDRRWWPPRCGPRYPCWRSTTR